MRVIPAAAYRRMPWKNGGGETIEIAASPDGAGLDAFDWRVSMARVERPGPFSLFPGVDRTLCVLEGAELTLRFEDGSLASLTQDSAPFGFAADIPVTATLAGGGITDLNVMTRRARNSHQVRRLSVAAPATLVEEDGDMLILLRGSGARIASDAGEHEIADGDAVLVGSGERITLAPAGPATLFAIAFHERRSG
jgi:environmental stress-induced protein Ves